MCRFWMESILSKLDTFSKGQSELRDTVSALGSRVRTLELAQAQSSTTNRDGHHGDEGDHEEEDERALTELSTAEFRRIIARALPRPLSVVQENQTEPALGPAASGATPPSQEGLVGGVDLTQENFRVIQDSYSRIKVSQVHRWTERYQSRVQRIGQCHCDVSQVRRDKCQNSSGSGQACFRPKFSSQSAFG